MQSELNRRRLPSFSRGGQESKPNVYIALQYFTARALKNGSQEIFLVVRSVLETAKGLKKSGNFRLSKFAFLINELAKILNLLIY